MAGLRDLQIGQEGREGKEIVKAEIDRAGRVRIEFESQAEILAAPDGSPGPGIAGGIAFEPRKYLPCSNDCGRLLTVALNVVAVICDECGAILEPAEVIEISYSCGHKERENPAEIDPESFISDLAAGSIAFERRGEEKLDPSLGEASPVVSIDFWKDSGRCTLCEEAQAAEAGPEDSDLSPAGPPD